MIQNQVIDLYGDGIGKVEYVDHLGSDLTIVNAARVSFGKHKDSLEPQDEKLIKYLMKNKHTSTLEHNIITFRFKVPLFVRGQHHRHRTWSYNEISRRYTDENVEFYEPKSFRSQHVSNKQASNLDEIDPQIQFPFVEPGEIVPAVLQTRSASELVRAHHKDSLRLYEALLEAGVSREQARGILSQNMYTEYYGTVNLNNLIKFIILRDDAHAQWEIQRPAQACRQIATELFPVAMNAFNELRSEKRE